MIEAINAGEGDNWIKMMNAATQGASRGTKVVAPDLGLDHGEVLKLHGANFRIYYNGRTHTNNDIMIEVVEEGVIFLGDNVLNKRIAANFPEHGNIQGQIAAIDLALKSKATHFIPGHGTSGGREIALAQQALLKEVAVPPSPDIETLRPEIEAGAAEPGEKTAASPQLGNGFTMFADEILEALGRVQISGHCWRILMVVFRQTYGWGKKFDWIAYEQFIEKTGLKKQRVYEAFKELCERNILTRSGSKVGFQKDYTQWKKPLRKNKSRKTVTVTEKRYSDASSNGKPKNCNGKTGLQYRLIQKTNEGVEPESGSTPSVIKPEKLDTLTKPPKVRTYIDPREARKKFNKTTDPRVSEIVRYFSDTCLELKGFPPKITGGKDGKNVKEALKTMELVEIRGVIRFFLESPKSKEVGVSLSAALSAHTINLYRAGKTTQGDPGLGNPHARRDPGL